MVNFWGEIFVLKPIVSYLFNLSKIFVQNSFEYKYSKYLYEIVKTYYAALLILCVLFMTVKSIHTSEVPVNNLISYLMLIVL